MKKGILFALILTLLTLIPFTPSDTKTKGNPIQICEYDNQWEGF